MMTLRPSSFAIAFLFAAAVSATAASGKDIPGAGPLITQRPDESQVVELAGNARPEVKRVAGWKPAPLSMQLHHIHLLLKRSAEQDHAAEAAVAALTDPRSASYHHWLTAAQFGLKFGAADADVAAVTHWLRSKGFTVNQLYPSRMMIDFSGNVRQIANAFHTLVGQNTVGGVTHFANMTDPEVPAALAPAIAGIVSLHDFHPHGARHPRPAVTAACGRPCNAVGAGDLATIYDLKRVFSLGYVGQGQTIAVVEMTNLYSNNDWYTFRSSFGLNQYASGNLQVVHPAPSGGGPCGDPGVNSGQDAEAALDTEWASAAAPGATIELASCASAGPSDGVFLAIENLINASAPPPVISVSYALCEADNGAAANAAFNQLYQQAAAEGISVFVASGDTGASACALGPGPTNYGIGVNGWGDSQYNVSVGGTDFADTYTGTNGTYWNADSGAPWSTARSYIPEIPWNDNCANTLLARYYSGSTLTYGGSGFCSSQTGQSFHTLSVGSGGPSGCYSGSASTPHTVSGSCTGYPKPAWQTGFPGNPADGVRDLPDVSLFAADGVWGHAYATCYSDPNGGGAACTGSPEFWKGNGGGTSYGAPIMAGIQTLVNQYKGARQGNPAPMYYRLAKWQSGSAGNPNCSSNLGKNIESDCIFHDVVSGDIDVYCTSTANCYWPGGSAGVLSTSNGAYNPAYKAMTGYDFATGIGTVDAYNLLIQWR